MTQFLAARRRNIQSKGRLMTLRRLLPTIPTVSDVALIGFLAMYRPEQIGIGSIMEGDATLSILDDEIAAASWGTPRARDQVIIDSRIWTVLGSAQLYDGSVLIGHTLQVRGG